MSEPKRYMDYGLETRRKNMANKMQEIAELKKKGFSTKEISEVNIFTIQHRQYQRQHRCQFHLEHQSQMTCLLDERYSLILKSPQSTLQSQENILFNIDSVLLEEPSLTYHSFVENCPQKIVEWTSVLFSTSSQMKLNCFSFSGSLGHSSMIRKSQFASFFRNFFLCSVVSIQEHVLHSV